MVKVLQEYVTECVEQRRHVSVQPLMSGKRLGPWRVLRWDKAELVSPAVMLFEGLASVVFSNPKRGRGYGIQRASLEPPRAATVTSTNRMTAGIADEDFGVSRSGGWVLDKTLREAAL